MPRLQFKAHVVAMEAYPPAPVINTTESQFSTAQSRLSFPLKDI